ncbi:RNA polymerase sigma factor [Spirosoma sp.]|uniref:RNA polymerase sigma factor n=1 Tax=Spirosoma sp. TaxID=1899569 RepID=UPI002610EA38|nr:RNA polymerase sigma factor [Spirosoma sp.]MCX6214612.1 RNA polymerase sigma factor [Spirosoma sp.]
MNQGNSLPELSDKQLLDGLRADDQGAWRQVYNTNRRKVIHYLRGRGASAEVAHEIYQDTMVFLDAQKHKLVLTSKLSTYLTGVAIKKLQAYWTEKTKEASRISIGFDSPVNRPNLTGDDIDEMELALLNLALEDDPRFALNPEEADLMVQKALAQIPLKHCADIFRMRYWDGFNDQEIADRLNLSHGSVRNQVGDCKKKVKSILLTMGWGQ